MSTATLTRPKARRTWTYDEFAAESLETNLPTELWDGEIIMSLHRAQPTNGSFSVVQSC